MSYQQLQGNRAYTIPDSATFSIDSYNPISGINQPSMRVGRIGYIDYMRITQLAGALGTIGFTSDIIGWSVAPTGVTITTESGGGSGATATASLNASTGALIITVNTGGSLYTNSSILTLNLTGGTLLPSVRCQPFRFYIGSSSDISVITAGGDSVNIVAVPQTYPFIVTSITTGASGAVAFW